MSSPEVRPMPLELRMNPEKLMGIAAEFSGAGLVCHDDRGLFCTACSQLIKMDRRHQRTQIWNHLKSAMHQSNAATTLQNQNSTSITEIIKKTRLSAKRIKLNQAEKLKHQGQPSNGFFTDGLGRIWDDSGTSFSGLSCALTDQKSVVKLVHGSVDKEHESIVGENGSSLDMQGSILGCYTPAVIGSVDIRDKHKLNFHESKPLFNGTNSIVEEPSMSGEKIPSSSTSGINFEVDLATAFIQAGIPLKLFNSASIVKFRHKYAPVTSKPDQDSRFRIIHGLYKSTIERIQTEVAFKKVVFSISDFRLFEIPTNDDVILTIFIHILDGKITKPLLFKIFRTKKVDANAIAYMIDSCCHDLWPTFLDYRLLAAAICPIRMEYQHAIQILQLTYSNLLYVPCLTEVLYEFCNALKGRYLKATSFLEHATSLLRQQDFCHLLTEFTGLSPPPQASMSYPDSMLKGARFFCSNFIALETFFKNQRSQRFGHVSGFFDNEQFRDEIFHLANQNLLLNVMDKVVDDSLDKETKWSWFEKFLDYARTQPTIFGDCLQKQETVLEYAKRFASSKDPEFRFLSLHAPLATINLKTIFDTRSLLLDEESETGSFEMKNMAHVVAYNGNRSHMTYSNGY